MKVLQVFNQYRSLFNGEELVVMRTQKMLAERGIECDLLMPSSREIQGLGAKVSACFSGIYSRSAEREMRELLTASQVDIVHCHNLYPLLSPSVLVACRKSNVPVVVSVHNQGLTCPTADHMRNNQMCLKCYGGKEFNCVLNNCRGNLVESVGYALRSRFARRWKLYSKNATLLIALTEFARQWLAGGGYDAEQIAVLHNFVDEIHPPVDPADGEYVAFAGRLSPEKDVATLLAAAERCGNLPVRVAGDGPLLETLRAQAPDNVEFLGRVAPDEMADFYRRAKCLVLPSRAFEMCPLVITEAMSHGVPVVASAIGGIDELVDDHVTGLLFEPGSAEDLASKMQRLFNEPETCRCFGAAGHEKAIREYAEEAYIQKLLKIYCSAAQRIHGETPQSFQVLLEQQS